MFHIMTTSWLHDGEAIRKEVSFWVIYTNGYFADMTVVKLKIHIFSLSSLIFN